jgi:hypothetical protein
MLQCNINLRSLEENWDKDEKEEKSVCFWPGGLSASHTQLHLRAQRCLHRKQKKISCQSVYWSHCLDSIIQHRQAGLDSSSHWVISAYPLPPRLRIWVAQVWDQYSNIHFVYRVGAWGEGTSSVLKVWRTGQKSIIAVYEPMIYTAPCIMFLMRADPLWGQVGGGWALEIKSFLTLWNGI